MSVRNIDHRQIVDLGMSEGNDSHFYLKKGFNVFGVEADYAAYQSLLKRFDKEISESKMRVVNRAAHETSGSTLRFHHNVNIQGHSHVAYDQSNPDNVDVFEVQTICWDEITETIGCTPYYCKIDIEGCERFFLKSFANSKQLPVYVSAEIHSFTPIELLYQAGYRKFKIINQTKLHRIKLPNPPLEGQYVEVPQWIHASGPFGRETPEPDWFDFVEAASVFDLINRAKTRLQVGDWFDVHAFMPA